MNGAFHQFKPRISESSEIRGNRTKIGAFSVIEDNVLIDSGDNPDSWINIGCRSKIKRGTTIKSYNGYVNIGNRVSIGENSILAGHGGILIGDATIIAGHCYISAANHIFTTGNYIRFQGEEVKGIHIGSDVWIGGKVMVIDGVSVGNGAVIGAGSIVTNDIPPNSKCYGNPCKIVEKRKSWKPIETNK